MFIDSYCCIGTLQYNKQTLKYLKPIKLQKIKSARGIREQFFELRIVKIYFLRYRLFIQELLKIVILSPERYKGNISTEV